MYISKADEGHNFPERLRLQFKQQYFSQYPKIQIITIFKKGKKIPLVCVAKLCAIFFFSCCVYEGERRLRVAERNITVYLDNNATFWCCQTAGKYSFYQDKNWKKKYRK